MKTVLRSLRITPPSTGCVLKAAAAHMGGVALRVEADSGQQLHYQLHRLLLQLLHTLNTTTTPPPLLRPEGSS